ncbi:MDR family MFS transporter [Lottiidibacillus patelloidae]|nr:MDR family MFS transporter [Lottiidibacillus patelloidae]
MNDSKAIESKRNLNRPLVLGSLILAIFMSAIEGTIVSTAIPSIVGDLGGFSLYSWVFSGYLVMQAATVLIYGKLADLFGRKPIFIYGIVVFLIGSVLCGFSTSMEMLIVFRFIQGLGAGAVLPIATTIVGDIYTLEERAKIQGFLSSVWGISAVVGPVLGGVLVEYIHWSYIFWINVPLGILSIIGVLKYFKESIEKKKHKIDYFGSVFMLIAVLSLMVILVQGGVKWAWTDLKTIFFLSTFVISAILFFFQEKRASNPMMPFSLWKHRLIALANTTSLTTGMLLIGISSFLPAYVQGVMGYSPMVAGFTLTTLSIGWPIAAFLAGRLVIKIGFRNTAIIGGAFLIVGGIFFVMLDPTKGPIWAGIGSFIIGLGMGLTNTTFIVAIQSSVDWKDRGIATASNSFMRTLGSTLGAALLGGVLNNRLQEFIKENNMDDIISIDAANLLLDEAQRNVLPESSRILLQEGLTLSLHSVYWGVASLAVISFLLTVFLPRKKEDDHKY